MKRKTLKAFVEQTSNPKLARAVVRQLGGWESAQESLPDIARHGVDGGFHGFIYHNDTVSFYRRNKDEILDVLWQMADDCGESVQRMMANWKCLKGLTEPQIRQSMHKLDSPYMTEVCNALAWFAAEEVAQWYAMEEWVDACRT
jgi:hypothetical protein